MPFDRVARIDDVVVPFVELTGLDRRAPQRRAEVDQMVTDDGFARSR